MQLDIARQAGVLATKRDQVAELLDSINNSITTAAPITKIEGAMNAEGLGSKLSCLPFGPANAENSAKVWETLRSEYTKMLDDLDKEIAKLDGPASEAPVVASGAGASMGQGAA